MLQNDKSLPGKKMTTSRMPTDIVEFIAIDDAMVRQAHIQNRLDRLTKLEESKIPTGSDSFEWEVTTSIKEIKLDRPWISFSLINDGSADIYLRVNELRGNILRSAPIKSGETVDRDFKYPIIHTIYLATSTGTATIRILAEEGKW